MTNRIGKLVKDIQYATDFTIEQIADKIDYSRAHLTRLAKHGDSQKAYDALKKEFGQIAQNTPVVSLQTQSGQKSKNTALDTSKDKLTTVTTKPDYGVRPTNGHQSDKDLVIKEQAQAANKLADSVKTSSETIKKLVDLLSVKGKD